MPRIPILPGDVSAAGAANDPFGRLPPAQADGIRALQARDDGITRGLTVAEAWRDGVSALHQAEGAEDGAPAGFARDFFANADRGRLVALWSTVPGQREALDDDLQGLRADLGDRAVTAEATGLALRRRLGLMQVLETYAGGVAEDPDLFDSADGRIAKLVEGLGLPETRAGALRTEMRTRLANSAVDGLMADPAEAEAALRLGLYDDVLPKEIKQQRLTEAETKLQRARLLDGERRRQTLSRRAAEGVADETEIDVALADGGLSEIEADRLRLQTRQAQQDAEIRRARIDRVASGAALDPADTEDRQAADAYWEEISETLAVDDSAQQQAAELDLVCRIGVVPDGLAKKYRGMLLSRDPEAVVQGARAIMEIEGIVGSDPGAIPAEESRRAAGIVEFADLGVGADRAIELADAKIEEEEVDETDSVERTPAGDPIVDNDQTESPFIAGADEREEQTIFDGPERRSIRTAEDFLGILDEAGPQSPEDVARIARQAGLSPPRLAIALRIKGLSDLPEGERADALSSIGKDIGTLPGREEGSKEKLGQLVTGLRPVLDDPVALNDALAANRNLFRDPNPPLAVDSEAVRRESFAAFERATGYTTLPVAVDGPAGPGSGSGVAFFRKGSETPFMTLPPAVALAIARTPEAAAKTLPLLEAWLGGTVSAEDLDQMARALLIRESGPDLDGTGEEIVDDSAYRAFLAAREAVEAGANPDEIAALMSPVLFPEAFRDPDAGLDFVLDMLPVIGDVRAILDVIDALEAGDVGAAVAGITAAGLGLAGGRIVKAVGTGIKATGARTKAAIDALKQRAAELRGRGDRGSLFGEAADGTDGSDVNTAARRGESEEAPPVRDGDPDPDMPASPRLTEVPRTGDPRIDDLAQRKPEKVRQRFEKLNKRKWASHEQVSSKELNDGFVKEHRAKSPKEDDAEPPHDVNFPSFSVSYRVADRGKLELVRVFPKKRRLTRGWLMLREDFDRIRKLPNAHEVFKTLFALDEMPEVFNHFIPPKGATVQMNYSVAGKNKFGPGGGVQFQLVGRVPDEWFGTTRQPFSGEK